MRMFGALLVGLGCLTPAAHADVFAHPKSADDLAKNLLTQPATALARAKILRGKFTHKKYLSEIPAPLEAQGEFTFLRGGGLYWHTLKPFESVFILTPDAIVQKDEGGAAVKLDASQQPAVHAAASIFMALFSVDLKSLSTQFMLFGSNCPLDVKKGNTKSSKGQKDTWQLGLRPKDSAMSAVFKQAIVSGAVRVREVELQDAHGDRTVIELLETELLDREPTAQERALLAPK